MPVGRFGGPVLELGGQAVQRLALALARLVLSIGILIMFLLSCRLRNGFRDSFPVGNVDESNWIVTAGSSLSWAIIFALLIFGMKTAVEKYGATADES